MDESKMESGKTCQYQRKRKKERKKKVVEDKV